MVKDDCKVYGSFIQKAEVVGTEHFFLEFYIKNMSR